MDKIIIIGEPQKHEPCEYCGKVDELRPYGKDGAKICFECGMKPENYETTVEAFTAVLQGDTEKPTEAQQN